MSDFELSQVLNLLELANSKGIKIGFSEGELAVSIPKTSIVDHAVLEQLKRSKGVLTEYFKNHSVGQSAPSSEEVIPAGNNLEKAPLSFSQERLWLFDQLWGSIEYHLPSVLRIKGPLQTDALQFALKILVQRHEVLRTLIRQENGNPYQQVHSPEDWNWTTLDATGKDAAWIKATIDTFIAKPFDLSADYMIRASLIHFAENDNLLIIVVHHIASDGWSLPIIVRELAEAYNAKVSGRQPSLPELAIQYCDYARWQRKHFDQARLDEKLSYWNKALQELRPLNLLTDYARSQGGSRKGAVAHFPIEKAISSRLHKLTIDNNVTLFMTLATVLKVLLFKYSGQTDISIGSPVANRDRNEIQGIVGFFVNMLPLRTDLTGNPSFIQLLQHVRDVALNAYEHQDAPFEKVVEAIVKERDMGQTPLFQVVFELNNNASASLSLTDLEIYPEPFENNTAKFDLTFGIAEGEAGLQLEIEYSTDLYDEQTIIRMGGHYKTLLQSVVDQPSLQISDLQMLPASELDQLVNDFNNTLREFPNTKTIVQLFEEQVARTPDQNALQFEKEEFTYAALNARVNQLARRLAANGVNKGDLVPICIERGTDMLIGMLSILKSGAAYVCIDPHLPQQRISSMLDDIGAGVVLSSAACKAKVQSDKPVIIVELDNQDLDYLDPSNLTHLASAGDLAYVVYTSGSNGKPKGVMIEHHSLVNLLTGIYKEIDFCSGCMMLAVTTYSFDISYLELFMPLVVGGTVTIVSRDVAMDGFLLKALLNQNSRAFMQVTPSTWQSLLDCEWTNEEGTIMLTGGEALPENLKENLMAVGKLWNLYGPTETTIWSATKVMDAQLVSIGKPIQNTEIYILGNHGEIVPIGVAGEIHIGGEGLARGYLNKLELTASRFPDVYIKGHSDIRLYKTGDLGKWLPSGDIQYLGRIDDQVKVRGHRVELKEVESVLLKHPQIKQVVVTTLELGEKNIRQLVAYLVSEDTIKSEALRDFAEASLPNYMIPAYFIQLPALPLTPNGKLDKKSLPAPAQAEQTNGSHYMAPRTAIEKWLVDIWQSILEKKHIGIEDNFFELGGDSIKSIQIGSRLRKHGYRLNVADILQYPTIRAVGKRAVAIIRQAEQSSIEGDVALSPVQQSFFRNAGKNKQHYNQSVLLFSHRPIEEETIRTVFNVLVSHHDALRMRFVFRDEQWYQVNMEDRPDHYDLQVYDWRNLDHDTAIERMGVKNEQVQSSLNLSEGPLLKLALFKLDDGCRLLIVIHHLVIDGVSWRILFEDIMTLYNRHLLKEAYLLPPKSDSFQYWMEKQVQYAQSAELLRNKSFWLQQQNKSMSPLVFDMQGTNKVKDARGISFSLPREITTQLLTVTHKAYHTEINDILLCALAMGMNEVFQMENVLVAVEGHGRESLNEKLDVSRTVGWFTILYPVVFKVDAGYDISRQLIEVKESLRSISGKAMSYGLLRNLAPREDGDVSLNLNPQVAFNYLGQFDQGLSKDDSETLFTFSSEHKGLEEDPENTRGHALEVNCMVIGGVFVLDISASRKQFKSETISQLSASCEKNLRALIRRCVSVKTPQLTPSDLTYKGFTIDQLTQLSKTYTSIVDVYRLSTLQEGMYYHGQQSGTAYFMQTCLRIQGTVDEKAFSHAFLLLLKRHEVLRTAFINDYNVPLQVVSADADPALAFEDISHLDRAAQQKWMSEYQETDKARGFDLRIAQLIRLSIIRLSDNEFGLIWSHHHILMDGWCLSILVSDFFSLYKSLSRHKTIQLPEPTPYLEYIRWLEKVDAKGSLDYWTKYLKGYENETSVPGASAHRAQSYKVAEVRLQFSRYQTSRLQSLGTQFSVTLNTIIQCVWGILLAKYNSTTDVVFGGVVSGRPAEIEDVEQIVGLFINTIPVRINTEGVTTFSDLIKQVQNEAIQSEPHHYVQLADVQSKSTLSQNLLNHIMVFENYPVAEQIEEDIQVGQSSMSVVDVKVFEQTNYDFNVVVLPGEKLIVNFNYNENRYDGEVVRRIGDHFTRIVEQVIVDPERKIEALDYLPADERTLVLNGFNDTFHKNACETVVKLVEQQAEKTPDAVALVCGSHLLTYRELNERSNQVAHLLCDRFGVGRTEVVGVMMERSAELIIALLGILKSGAAYLPLDVEYPKQRIAYIIKDAAVKLVLTDTFPRQVLDHDEVPSFPLEPNWFSSSGYPSGNLNLNMEDSDLAYVIYTSGSTGNPKGCQITHKNLSNYIRWANTYYFNDGSAGDWALYTSISFDLTVTSIYTALTRGRRLHVLESKPIDGLLIEAFSIEGLDTIKVTPSHLSLLKGLSLTQTSIRTVICGGEQLSWDQVRSLWAINTSIRIFNEYGPTETTVGCVVKEIKPEDERIVIGKPIWNTRIYVLDGAGHPAGVGIEGELYISGDCVGHGYRHNEILTRARFIDDPFNIGSMYRTGDKARWLPEGQLEYLGRIDEQVKIRGYRIELGEIENVLRESGLVEEAVVLATAEDQGNKKLVGYLVPKSNYDKEKLIASLKDRLPAYMVPSNLVLLAKLPLTPNGKADRKALLLYGTPYLATHKYVPPRNALEKKLADMWMDVLQVQQVGLNDNFFGLGGHSLKAMQLLSRIRRAFEIKIELSDLFLHADLPSQSKYVSMASPSKPTHISRVAPQERYPLSQSQYRFWILNELSNNATAYNIPGALELKGELDNEALQKAFLFVIDRHEILRTAFMQDSKEEIHQYVLPFHTIKFKIEFHDVSVDSGRTLSDIWKVVQETIFDLTRPPLLNVHLIRLGAGNHALLYAMHHIISDGWSMEILAREVVHAYNAFINNTQPSFPPLTIHYKDYAVWQQQEFQREVMNEHMAYWHNAFAAEQPVLNLPSEKIRPYIRSYNGNSILKKLTSEIVQPFTKLCHREGATLFMGLEAALKVLLNRYTGEHDITLGTLIAGRPHQELENQIGLYLNTLALRTQLGSGEGFIEVLRREKDVVMDAYAHQSYPFDLLVETLHLKRDLSRSPLFDIIVLLHNQNTLNLNSAAAMGALQVTPLQQQVNRASLFDLEFSFVETGQTLTLSLTYNTDVYDLKSVERLFSHFERLLHAINEEPTLDIAVLDYLLPVERDTILSTFNNTYADYPRDKTISELFEYRAKQHPNAIAVEENDRQLTFKGLNELSNQLANSLQDSGVEKDVIVSILANRSIEMMICMLAVWKAGGAILLIDPDLPEERINFMLAECACRLLLYDDKSVRNRTFGSATLMNISSVANEEGIRENLLKRSCSRDLSYVIFTSGSTGTPKGVMVEHMSKLNHIYAFIRCMSIDSTSVIAQTAPASFDILLWQMVTGLLVGAKTIIYSKEAQLDVEGFIEQLIKDGVTIFEHVPSFLSNMCEIVSEHGLKLLPLTNLVSTGEELKKKFVNKWFSVCPHIRLINVYGPTEASDDVTIYAMDGVPVHDRIPIGIPIQNSKLFIVDQNLLLCPIGVSGEIAVAGECLSRGYIRKELNASRFKNAAFGNNEMLYLTGDVGKWLPDGNIQFAGRNDTQVKVRGHRIELGEIESVLLKHQDVSEVVVIVSEDNEDAAKSLLAYVVSNVLLENGTLRKYAEVMLPSYMVPSYFIQLPKFPLTANGKVDKKLLPRPELSDHSNARLYVAPHTEVEKKLVEVWESVLGKPNIGIQDNFFDLGGDSIRSIQVGSRMRKYGYAVKVADILQYPVIAELAKKTIVIGRQAEQGTVTGPVLLSPAQRLFLQQPTRYYHNRAVALSSHRDISENAVHEIFTTLVSHHDALRMRFYLKGNEWHQQNESLDIEAYSLEVHNVRSSVAQRPTELMTSLTRYAIESLDLTKEPIVKLVLFKLDEGCRLLIVSHHLITDEGSWHILLEDFITLFHQRVTSTPYCLPSKTDSFQHWMLQQQIRANTPQILKQNSYWKKLAAYKIASIATRVTQNRPLLTDIGNEPFSLSAEHSTTLLTAGNTAYNMRPHEILLCVLGMALDSVFGCKQILVDVEEDSREAKSTETDMSRTIGCFTTVFPMILNMNVNVNDIATQLIGIKETIRAVPDNGKTYGLLKYMSAQNTVDDAVSLQPEILFSYRNANYAGNLQTEHSYFNFSVESTPMERVRAAKSIYLIEIDTARIDGELKFNFTYDRNFLDIDTIGSLVECYRRHLEEVRNHCAGVKTPQMTPSDLGNDDMSIDDFNDIFE